MPTSQIVRSISRVDLEIYRSLGAWSAPVLGTGNNIAVTATRSGISNIRHFITRVSAAYNLTTADGLLTVYSGNVSQTAADGAITSGQNLLTSSTLTFLATDVERQITVAGAGSSGALLTTRSTGFKALKTSTDGTMNAPTAILTSPTIGFVPSDVTRPITVTGVGVAGATLSTTVLSYQSATQVTLAVAASTTVTGTATITLPLAITLLDPAGTTVTGATINLTSVIAQIYITGTAWLSFSEGGTPATNVNELLQSTLQAQAGATGSVTMFGYSVPELTIGV